MSIRYLAHIGLCVLVIVPQVVQPTSLDLTPVRLESGGVLARGESSTIDNGDFNLCSASMGNLLAISNNGQVNQDPAAAYNSVRDEFLVAWLSSQASVDRVRVRVVGWDGLLTPSLVAAERSAQPVVAYNPDLDRYLLVLWDPPSLWAQQLAANGSPIGSAVQIPPPEGSGSSGVTSVTYNLNTHEYLIISQYVVAGGLGGGWELIAQRLAAGSLEVLGEIIVTSGGWGWNPFTNETSGSFSPPSDVVFDHTRNQYLIAYGMRYGSTGPDGEVKLQFLSGDLSTVGSAFSLGLEGYKQERPHLAYGIDQYLVVFGQGLAEGSDAQGYGRRIAGEGDPSGSPLGPESGFQISPAAPHDIDFGASYGFLAVWEEGNVLGRYILPNSDEPCGKPFTILATEPGEPVSPTISCAPSGDCLVLAPSEGGFTSSEILGRFVFRPELTFEDVVPAHWAYQFIELLAFSGLTAGYPDGTYRPDNPVTRAEMAVFLKKGIHGSNYTPPATDGSHPFGDIAGHWAEDWIEDLFDEGFTSGFPDRTFRPDNQGTRAEMAVFLKKAIHGSAYVSPTPDGSHPFSDIAGHWAEGWMEDLYDEGITSGYPDGTYRPENQVTRAEMAVFLVNAFNLPLP